MMSKLKVLYIGQEKLGDSGAGGAARVENMVSTFRMLDIEVHLISYSTFLNKFGIDHEKKDEYLHTTIVNVPSNLPLFLKGLTIFPISYYAYKESKNCDFIFADLVTIVTSIPAVILKLLRKKPLILDYIDIKLSFVPSIVNNFLIRNSDIIFAISPYLFKSAIEKKKGKNVIYFPNCIDTDSFNLNLSERQRIRNELGFTYRDIVLGYAGSFRYVEGVPILLEAYQHIKKNYYNVKLVIIGKVYVSKYDDDIEKILKKYNLTTEVILIPSKPHNEIPKYLSSFDILCCPKIDCEINRAANPIKVTEYLSMGLPTIASAVGGINDTIDDKVTGFLVKPGDVVDLEKQIEWIIKNPSKAKKIGESGRQKVVEKYSFQACKNVVKDTLCNVFHK